ncbi:MAG: cytochrome c1 [Pseudomonadota bacterium]
MRGLPASICLLMLIACGHGALAAGGGHGTLQEANVSLWSKSSLQRGARTFVNYCLSCHSAQYMRYGRMAEDLGLSERLVKENMMFATDKILDPMKVAMRPEDSEVWFGAAPPDLSVTARSRGADWIYSFLLSFYADESRPTGVNNLVYPATAMPHVLWELQGIQENVTDEEGHSHLELSQPGKLSAEEYEAVIRDLTAFLVYVGEPAKLVRYRMGFWVLGFLLILFFAAFMMKREYWKDIH